MLGVGCRATPEKVRAWKETEKGPSKIREALRDRASPVEVRVEAVLALADLGMQAELASDLGAIPSAERAPIAVAALSRLLTMMKGAGPGGTTDLQIRAKDVIAQLRTELPAGERARVDGELVLWLLADWGRRRTGEASGDKVLLAIGGPAGAELAKRLTGSAEYLPELAELLAKVGGASERESGAEALVALARAEPSRRRGWLEALGKLRSVVGREFLLSLARRGDADERALAVQALGAGGEASSLPFFARLAADVKEPGGVREAAFAAIERVGGAPAMEVLAGFLVSQNETVRYRTAEALVACCKARGVAKLLDALPSGYAYKRQDVADYLEKDIREVGSGVLPVLREALKAKSWVARVVAVRLLGEMGAKEDVPRLEALRADATPLLGWGPGATLGTEARAAAERLRKRN